MTIRSDLPAILQNASLSEREAFRRFAIRKTFSAGALLAMEGDACAHFFVVAEGSIRVYKPAESGREITLYHVQRDESCVLTAFCILGKTPFPAFAMAETALTLYIIPSDVMRDWVERFDSWRRHMFNSLNSRLNEILKTIDKVVFRPLDARIAAYVLQNPGKITRVTHEGLAREIGSSRVAVSRLLGEFEKNGWVMLKRGRIIVQDAQALQKIVQKSTST